MRILILLLASGFLFSGCAKMKSWLPSGPRRNANATRSPDAPSVTSTSNSGKVAMVNLNARFVVMTFSIGDVPPINQKLHVYRNGLKVAEVKVTGPRRDNNTVADLLSGEAQVNDDVHAD